MKHPEHLRIAGNLDYMPEYRSAYGHINMGDRYLPKKIIRPIPAPPDPYTEQKSPKKGSRPCSPKLGMPPCQSSKKKSSRPCSPTIGMPPCQASQKKSSRPCSPKIGMPPCNSGKKKTRRRTSNSGQKKRDIQKEVEKCHQALGDNEMEPTSEFRSIYVEQPRSRSRIIPQGTHVTTGTEGRFQGIPEYQDSFQGYLRYVKNAPCRRNDNLHMSGTMEVMPEYTERFREHDFTRFKRRESYRKSDNLRPGGDFTKDQPEYYESFKDPHITARPEKGKCRDTYLKVGGDTDWKPEYR